MSIFDVPTLKPTAAGGGGADVHSCSCSLLFAAVLGSFHRARAPAAPCAAAAVTDVV